VRVSEGWSWAGVVMAPTELRDVGRHTIGHKPARSSAWGPPGRRCPCTDRSARACGSKGHVLVLPLCDPGTVPAAGAGGRCCRRALTARVRGADSDSARPLDDRPDRGGYAATCYSTSTRFRETLERSAQFRASSRAKRTPAAQGRTPDPGLDYPWQTAAGHTRGLHGKPTGPAGVPAPTERRPPRSTRLGRPGKGAVRN